MKRTVYKAAVVQSSPIFLDLEKSIDKAIYFDSVGGFARSRNNQFPGSLVAGLPLLD